MGQQNFVKTEIKNQNTWKVSQRGCLRELIIKTIKEFFPIPLSRGFCVEQSWVKKSEKYVWGE